MHCQGGNEMKLLSFSGRVAKEILRDPLNFGFGLGFPLILILLLTAIQANIPAPLFVLDSLTPGIAVFGLAFLTLFSATLLAKDRETALLARLYTTPMTAADFIIGYLLPFCPIAAAQSIICYLAAIVLGLHPTLSMVWCVLSIVPVSLFFIALGLVCGSVLTVKQVGDICGALLTNLTAWLSGVWFDLDLMGGAFHQIANALPFVHAVELERGILAGASFSSMLPHIAWIAGYALVTLAAAILLFLRQMRKQ